MPTREVALATDRPTVDPLSPEIEIAVLQKNANEQVRIRLTQYRGMDLLDIRVFYEASNGDMRPTQKGVCVRTDMVWELIAALEQAADAVLENERAATDTAA